MANYKSQKEIINEIAANLEKLEGKKLSIAELEEHVDLVRELYERTVVLRFKIFEDMSTFSEVKTEKAPKAKSQESIAVEPIVDVPASKVEQVAQVELPQEEIIDELPSIDFSLFEEQAEEVVSEQASKNQKISSADTLGGEDEKPAEVVVQEVVEETTKPSEEKAAEEEPEKKATPKQLKPEQVGTAGSFDKKFDTIVGQMKGQLGFSKLDTLVGSFGLNERLQYINELFDGSSDHFSAAIKEFDKLQSTTEAKETCLSFSVQYSWDAESETVEEFIQKICRRYA